MFSFLWSRPESRRDAPRARPALVCLEERATPAVVTVDDTYSATAGQVLTVSVPQGVLANDYSTAGQALSAKLASPPSYSTTPPGSPPPPGINFNANGSFTLVVPSNLPQGTTIKFTYTATEVGFPFQAATGNVTITLSAPTTHLMATGADVGGGPQVNVYEAASGIQRFAFFPYEPTFTGGVRVAVGDLNNDGVDDVVTVAGKGGSALVRVFDGNSGAQLAGFFAFDPNFRGGGYVAVGDVDGDGQNDIIVGAGDGGAPLVQVYDGKSFALKEQFFAYDPLFTGGVRVAAGDLRAAGRDFIITGAGVGGGPEVKAFDGIGAQKVLDFFAYSLDQRGGVNVAAGDLNGNGQADIITGSGSGNPLVNIFDGRNGTFLRGFTAFAQVNPTGTVQVFNGPSFTPGAPGFNGTTGQLLAPATVPGALVPSTGTLPVPSPVSQIAGAQGGVNVATVFRNNDSIADIMTGPGPGSAPIVRIFDGANLTEIDNFPAYGTAFLGGVFVA